MERAEVLAVALWPPGDAAVPATTVSEPGHSTAQERADAVALRRSGVSTAEVASRYFVAESTVKMWCA